MCALASDPRRAFCPFFHDFRPIIDGPKVFVKQMLGLKYRRWLFDW
jgi:hypothetical protein